MTKEEMKDPKWDGCPCRDCDTFMCNECAGFTTKKDIAKCPSYHTWLKKVEAGTASNDYTVTVIRSKDLMFSLDASNQIDPREAPGVLLTGYLMSCITVGLHKEVVLGNILEMYDRLAAQDLSGLWG